MSLDVEAHGPPDAPAVVLLHGFPLDGAMWRHQVAALRGSHLVLVPELPGASRTMDQMADAVAQALHARGIARADVVGFSMGGYVALAFAARHPERIRRLVFVDTRAEADSPEGRAKRMTLRGDVEREGPPPAVRAMLPGMLTPATWARSRDLVEEVRAMMLRQPTPQVLAMVDAMADRPDRTGMLAHIVAPTLVVVGEEDHVTPPDAARAMQQRIAGARLAVVAGAAHLTPMEQPGALNALLAEFLGEP